MCLRPCTLYDAALNNLDKHIMLGLPVNSLSHTFYSLYPVAEWVYYGLFGIIGAALLLLCLFGDRKAAMQMSGTILIAYFMSLTVFYFIPALGPFVEGDFPPANLYSDRATGLVGIRQVAVSPARNGFHCWRRTTSWHFRRSHLAQPVIAAWFLRRWKRVSLVIVAYCILSAPSILILRWHYLVDIIGGLIVGAAAIAITSFLDSDAENRRTSGPLTDRTTTDETRANSGQANFTAASIPGEASSSTIRTHRLGMVDENLPCSILTARAGLSRTMRAELKKPVLSPGAVDDPTV